MARCDSYYPGECTRGACDEATWVDDGWGNAWQWAGRAAAEGFQLTGTPTVGAIVVYGAGNGYSAYGHVGIVADVFGPDRFRVHEMNYIAWDDWDDRDSSTFDVTGFILPPGVAPGSGAGGQLGGGAAAPFDVEWSWGQLQDVWNNHLPAWYQRALITAGPRSIV